MTVEEKKIIMDFLELNYKNNYNYLGDFLTSNTTISPVDKKCFIYRIEKLRKSLEKVETNNETIIRTRKGIYNEFDDSIPENKREVTITEFRGF